MAGLSGKIVGLHDKGAARTAHREMPDIEEAKQIVSGYSHDQIMNIARKGFRDPSSCSPEEVLVLIAHIRVRFA